jgi:hypothetical protein
MASEARTSNFSTIIRHLGTHLAENFIMSKISGIR